MTHYSVAINTTNGRTAVTINGSEVRSFASREAADAFCDGLFYDGYPRESLSDSREWRPLGEQAD